MHTLKVNVNFKQKAAFSEAAFFYKGEYHLACY